MSSILKACPDQNPNFLQCLCEHNLVVGNFLCLSECFRSSISMFSCDDLDDPLRERGHQKSLPVGGRRLQVCVTKVIVLSIAVLTSTQPRVPSPQYSSSGYGSDGPNTSGSSRSSSSLGSSSSSLNKEYHIVQPYFDRWYNTQHTIAERCFVDDDEPVIRCYKYIPKKQVNLRTALPIRAAYKSSSYDSSTMTMPPAVSSTTVVASSTTTDGGTATPTPTGNVAAIVDASRMGLMLPLLVLAMV